MAAGDAERWAGDEHARAWNFAIVDAVSHGHIGKAICAYVTDDREASEKSEARVFSTLHRAARNRCAKALITGVRRIACDVGVHVYQTREARCVRKIDRALWERVASDGDGRDSAAGI